MIKNSQINYNLVIDVTLRVVNILSRVFFNFVALIKLSSVDFGVFVYIQAIIAICQYIGPLDFSLIGHRNILSKRISIAGYICTNIPILLIGLSISQLIIISIMWGKPITMILMVTIILILEVISSESQRLLVVMSKFTSANILLSLKTSVWMTCLMFYWSDSVGNLTTLVYCWVLGLTTSIIYFMVRIYSLHLDWQSFRFNTWLIKEFLKKVPIIILGTLAIRSLFSLDRIVMEFYNGFNLSGVYGFYVGVASAFLAVLDALYLTRSYPLIVDLVNRRKNIFLRRYLRNFIYISLVAAILGEFGYFLLIDEVMLMINKKEILVYSNVGYWLIASYAIYAASFGFHYVAYANHKDGGIALSNILSLTPFLSVFFMKDIDLLTISIILLFSTLINFFAKYILCMYLYRIRNIVLKK